ncbi:hypothetical protein HAX54_048472, partial [Datura stramonium]|nr:hypothetical protein [Datura stramonium]
MAKVVNAQLESLQSLDFHISLVLYHDETTIIYLDGDVESNKEDPSSYYLAITTRNGKVLQSEP